jgi:hypothetical protein
VLEVATLRLSQVRASVGYHAASKDWTSVKEMADARDKAAVERTWEV